MKITELKIRDVRCFAGEKTLPFSQKINLFIGKNNSGKSTLLKCLQIIQIDGIDSSFSNKLNRHKVDSASITITFSNFDERLKRFVDKLPQDAQSQTAPSLIFNFKKASKEVYYKNPNNQLTRGKDSGGFSSEYPDNLIVYFLGKRKVWQFESQVNNESSIRVNDTLQYLPTKISCIHNANEETSNEFKSYCKSILGNILVAKTKKGQSGVEAGFPIDQHEYIPMSCSGEGSLSIAGLLVELCNCYDKIFLIEELENDLHPEALKSLLELISKKSSSNQFFISTHSNIVVRYLGSEPETKVFEITPQTNATIPTSEVQEIEGDESSRISLLNRLGYEPFDFGLWSGYLILEESSAESIINQILIPQFAPYLIGKLRTISTNGTSQIEPTYNDFKRLMIFTHKTHIYSKRTWVRADGDDSGKAAIEKLKSSFQDKEPNVFKTYRHIAFELYYPADFKNKYLLMPEHISKNEKRESKRKICTEVLSWAAANESESKRLFAESAKEIIEDLLFIEKELKSTAQT